MWCDSIQWFQPMQVFRPLCWRWSLTSCLRGKTLLPRAVHQRRRAIWFSTSSRMIWRSRESLVTATPWRPFWPRRSAQKSTCNVPIWLWCTLMLASPTKATRWKLLYEVTAPWNLLIKFKEQHFCSLWAKMEWNLVIKIKTFDDSCFSHRFIQAISFNLYRAYTVYAQLIIFCIKSEINLFFYRSWCNHPTDKHLTQRECCWGWHGADHM